MTTDLEAMFQLPPPVIWDDQQKEAIRRCVDVTERVVPVTGKAGTGKTAIIREVYDQLTRAGYDVSCSAPTGKAAKRIKEETGIDAMTNHRLLGYGEPIEKEIVNPHTGEKETVKLSTGPKFTRQNPLHYDVLLCDEYAMVNRELHGNLIAAMKHGAKIRMMGDINQLRPIEEDMRLQAEPSAFQRALSKFNGVELTSQHRQSEGSGIAFNGARILKGVTPVVRDDFKVIYTSLPVKVLQDTVMEALENKIDYSTPDHQIITCMNKSWVGAVKLNAIIQQIFWLNDRPPLILPRWVQDKEQVRIQVGSKVVYTANTYDLGDHQSYVFNGEIGTVVDIDHHNGTIDIDLCDRVITIPPWLIVEIGGRRKEYDPRCNLSLAYALTTHKMQGSECQHSIYIMNKSTIYGQSRRNFYTGVTRARKHCTVISDSQSMSKSTKYAG